MELKVSARDKMLLIVLAVILAIFGAVMFPSVGIKDSISAIRDANRTIEEQEMANDELRDKLREAGIAAYGESLGGAKNALYDDILQCKYDAIKVQQNTLAVAANEEKAYAVADEWLQAVEHQYFEAGNNKLYAVVSVTGNAGAFSDMDVTVGDAAYPVQKYTCTLGCTATNNAYTLELEYMNDEMSKVQMNLLISTYDLLCERGSVTVNSWSFNEKSIMMNLELIIPDSSNVAEYASQIGECHDRGKPYYLSDYNTELANNAEGVKCKGCGKLLTGEAMQ